MDENEITDGELSAMWAEATPVDLIPGQFLWDQGSSSAPAGEASFVDTSPRNHTSPANELSPA